jgi:hypothetical protein
VIALEAVKGQKWAEFYPRHALTLAQLRQVTAVAHRISPLGLASPTT